MKADFFEHFSDSLSPRICRNFRTLIFETFPGTDPDAVVLVQYPHLVLQKLKGFLYTFVEHLVAFIYINELIYIYKNKRKKNCSQISYRKINIRSIKERYTRLTMRIDKV